MSVLLQICHVLVSAADSFEVFELESIEFHCAKSEPARSNYFIRLSNIDQSPIANAIVAVTDPWVACPVYFTAMFQ